MNDVTFGLQALLCHLEYDVALGQTLGLGWCFVFQCLFVLIVHCSIWWKWHNNSHSLSVTTQICLNNKLLITGVDVILDFKVFVCSVFVFIWHVLHTHCWFPVNQTLIQSRTNVLIPVSVNSILKSCLSYKMWKLFIWYLCNKNILNNKLSMLMSPSLPLLLVAFQIQIRIQITRALNETTSQCRQLVM